MITDSYWILEGLLISEMHETAKGLIKNMLFLVNEYGFMLNGARLYYLNRSEPPLLVQMVALYYEVTKDMEFLKESLPILDIEYKYWIHQQSAPKPYHDLSTYSIKVDYPRPEEYLVDIQIADKAEDRSRDDVFSNIAHGETEKEQEYKKQKKICGYCGKVGHVEHECYSKQYHDRMKKDKEVSDKKRSEDKIAIVNLLQENVNSANVY